MSGAGERQVVLRRRPLPDRLRYAARQLDGVWAQDSAGQARLLAAAALVEQAADELEAAATGRRGPSRYEGAPVPCPHCPDGHQRPDWGRWTVYVAEVRDGDSQPTTLHVARPDGAHIAEADAAWARDVLNGRTCRQHTKETNSE